MTSTLGEGVEHRQLKDWVYLKLREEIVATQLPPGYVLREAELAARFGVSKTPLREAFVRLEKDGFVQIAPYRSAVVSGYSRQDLREIYEVRELLEGQCAREAAVNIATEDLAALNRIVRDSAAALAADDTSRLAALLDEFDVLLYAQSKNSRITAMLNNIRDHVTPDRPPDHGHPRPDGHLGARAPGHLRGHRAAGRAAGGDPDAPAHPLGDGRSAGQPGPRLGVRALMTSSSDVLIVGAGSAGLFCALGLAGSASVTVVETGPDAGTPPPPWMLYDYLLPAECYHSYADADTGLALPQGRGTGGGSTVNSAAALRGQPWCYDGWAVPGWSWQDCLPAFCAIESDQQFGDAAYHGTAGPIPVTRLTPGPLDDAFTGLCAKRGHPAAADHNAPGALGIGGWPTNRRHEGRWGTHAAVLPLIRGLVDLRAGTRVERLVFDGTRCVGADVTGPDGPERLHADRVVLCAGAFGTPLLLMRSGIGPEPVLREAGVELLTALPGVGENLQDHPWCLLDVQVTDVADIEARPVSGSLLRYELPGDHVEAEIFPWQTQALRPVGARRPGLVHRGADDPAVPGAARRSPPAGRGSRPGTSLRTRTRPGWPKSSRPPRTSPTSWPRPGWCGCPRTPGGGPGTWRRPAGVRSAPTTTTAAPAGWVTRPRRARWSIPGSACSA